MAYRLTRWSDYKVIPYSDYDHFIEEFVPLPDQKPKTATTELVKALQRLHISTCRPPGLLKFKYPENLEGLDKELLSWEFDRVIVVYNVTRLGHSYVVFENGYPPKMRRYRLFVILGGHKEEHAQDLIGFKFFNRELELSATVFEKGDRRHRYHYDDAIACLHEIRQFELKKVRLKGNDHIDDGDGRSEKSEKDEKDEENQKNEKNEKSDMSTAAKLLRRPTMYLREKFKSLEAINKTGKRRGPVE